MKKFDLGPVISEFVLWTHYVRSEIILTNTLYLMYIWYFSLPIRLIYIGFDVLSSGYEEFYLLEYNIV
jgi:hypothetical protein